MRDGHVKLRAMDNGWAYVEINCTPKAGLSPEAAQDPRGKRIFDMLAQIEGVTSVVINTRAVMVDLRVPEMATAGELYRLAQIMTVIVTDVLRAPA